LRSGEVRRLQYTPRKDHCGQTEGEESATDSAAGGDDGSKGRLSRRAARYGQAGMERRGVWDTLPEGGEVGGNLDPPPSPHLLPSFACEKNRRGEGSTPRVGTPSHPSLGTARATRWLPPQAPGKGVGYPAKGVGNRTPDLWNGVISPPPLMANGPKVYYTHLGPD